jgi:hypothetical protein
MALHARLPVLTLVLSLTLYAGGALADGDKGFELTLRPGYGSAGADSPVRLNPDVAPLIAGGSAGIGKIYDGTASPYGGGFVGQMFVGYRAMRYVSFGLQAGYRKSSASSVDDGSTGLARSAINVGPYVRAYLPLDPMFEPWIGIGVGYLHDVQTYSHPVAVRFSNGSTGTVDGDISLTHHGVAVPLSIGIDYRVLPMFAIGPSFEYTLVASAGGCAKASAGGVSNSQCTDANPKITSANGYHVWSIGLDLRLTL